VADNRKWRTAWQLLKQQYNYWAWQMAKMASQTNNGQTRNAMDDKVNINGI